MTRLYRVLLHLFPSEFRTRYGDELIALFVAERLEPRHAGALGLLRFWRHILYDLVTTATRQRTRQIRRMFDSVGHSVVKLKRIRIGDVADEFLPVGKHRKLTPVEIKALSASQPSRSRPGARPSGKGPGRP